ncbi:MAG TPA: ABC transporter permease subunit [Burkholderiaceae bacterium]|nr:ABC transporter permease subunit [Burkholderiaceae bacterium]HMY99930.1 ABC transporter permease subunit [Burkholderiaceae bacterium]HNB46802.1 ABC transporter permease subunit [Burkholderiaceae bacterium]HNG80141.1 ABC transporter permease subunit [Burkholderiaceae bacterium]
MPESTAVIDAADGLPVAEPSRLRAFWLAFSENRGAVAGLVVVALIALAAVFADWVAPHSPIEQYREAVKLPPMWVEGGQAAFPLGTDSLGRDMLSRLIHGARVSLFIGLAVMSVSFVVGVLLGLACAASQQTRWGQAVDVLISRVMDLIMAVPSLVLAILVVAVLGPSLTNTIVAVTIVYLPRYVRLVRAAALAELGKDYVTAARVSGVQGWRLMARTVLPNCLAPLIVQAALGVSDAILEAAALGFLGLGAQPPTAEWGTMLADAREFIRSNPWLVTLPGLAILITVVAINLAGDGLRDALDPKLRRS